MIQKLKEHKNTIIFIIVGLLTVLLINEKMSFISMEDKNLIRYKQNIQDSVKTLKELEFKKEKIENFRICNEKKLNDLINWVVNDTNCQTEFKTDLTSWIIPKTSASEESIDDILDSKIKRFCWEHELSDELYFEEDMNTRCTLILQGIYRFETWNLKSYVWNNIFNFRSPAIKKQWKEKYWVNEIRWWFLVFPDKTNSIKFAVDRFYRVDRYKTIKMIVWWWCYISPVDSKKKCFPWYTFTEEHKNNYISYLKNYYKNNL